MIAVDGGEYKGSYAGHLQIVEKLRLCVCILVKHVDGLAFIQFL
jgi:hypothetical protein